ncbi:MAG: hypothetical protein HRT67_13205 [Flavobacteriaceae bacterium]|nr:hypothetical protein [Flavobacteriaceae bacterium]
MIDNQKNDGIQFQPNKLIHNIIKGISESKWGETYGIAWANIQEKAAPHMLEVINLVI